ncbi:hypothetical protein XELAEV_18041103mg [Xenopus laevis]|uniref:Uncharacterized protein n=1 Tax=Xenopus laevis TaxID=8355 RepID=A0A974H4T8_XENLA|nr:hypothetical protein XELAEV_18041103mg [Xenopus laevis]
MICITHFVQQSLFDLPLRPHSVQETIQFQGHSLSGVTRDLRLCCHPHGRPVNSPYARCKHGRQGSSAGISE